MSFELPDENTTQPQTPAATPVTVSVTPRAFLRAQQSANARLTGGKTAQQRWMHFFLWFAVGIGAAWLVLRSGQPALGSIPSWSILALAAVWILAGLAQRRRAYRRLSAAQLASFALAIEPDGLRITNERGVTLLRWSALEAIERLPDAAHFHFRGYQVVWVERASFSEEQEFEDFVAAIAQQSGIGTSGCRPPTEPLPPTSTPHPLRTLFADLVAGFAALVLIARSPDNAPPRASRFVLLMIASLAAQAFFDWNLIEGAARFNFWAVPYVAFAFPLFWLAAWATARAEGLDEDGSRVVDAATALAGIWLALLLIGQILFQIEPYLSEHLLAWQSLISLALFIWAMLAMGVALCRRLELLPEARVGALLAVITLLALPLAATSMEDGVRLWMADQRRDTEAALAYRERWNRPVQESVLYTQPQLLDAALKRIQPGRPGIPEVFLLAVAGHGSQDVFKREVEKVAAQFDRDFEARGHTVVLANNPETVLDTPMATVTAIKRALTVIGQRMNRDEDVLFLFMTSHGSENHRFDLSLYPYRLADLTPEVLKQALAEAGIRYRVIVVSACYSGGFVPPLADPNTLVMSAARADRNSHGCAHEADWTFFGRAYFDEALKETPSFRKAFDLATVKIAEREKAEDLTPSEPQLAEGKAIGPVLARLEERLSRRPARPPEKP